MYNTFFYNQMFNPNYVNQQYYLQNLALVQQHQMKQVQEVQKVVNAVRDICKAMKELDAQHQQQAFYLCLAEMANQLGWNR